MKSRGFTIIELVITVAIVSLLATAVVPSAQLHLALDAHYELRMHAARLAALERDGYSCRRCGARAPHVGTHLWQQPWMLPSYGTENLVSLCDRCHELAHDGAAGADSWS